MAQVTVAFDAWKEGHVAHSLHAVPVVAPKSSVQLEPVSPRLKGELIHPNRTSLPCGLHFSPDGKRIIAGDDPGGVVVVWDVQSGRDIRTIETGYDYHGDEYLFLSPDWRTVFVPHTGKTNFEQFEKDGKRLFRWEFDGAVRTWDLTTGQLRRTYKHQPPRQIFGMELSPDGRKFVTFERPPGIHAGKPKWTVSLWDTATGQYRPLAKDLQANKARFSPDGRLLAIEAMEYSGYRALELFDTTTGREKKLSVPAPDKNARLSVSAFSPDGRVLAGDYQLVDPDKRDSWQHWLKWWDVATGRDIGSFAEQKNSFHESCFSPDGQTLAVTDWGRVDEAKLYLFRGSDRQPAHTLIVGQKRKGERLLVRRPVFSPDGKWLALIMQALPEDIRRGDDMDVLDVAQPRIHLIDVANGAMRETLIAPQGIAMWACFSPDGKTLATGGYGRVLLWDLAKLPGTTDPARKP